MTRPEWRVQGTKPLMYSHINSHNIHIQLLDDKSYKITICQVCVSCKIMESVIRDCLPGRMVNSFFLIYISAWFY